MTLNGWQRAFVVLAGIVGLTSAARWILDQPTVARAYYASGCPTVASYFTQEEARKEQVDARVPVELKSDQPNNPGRWVLQPHPVECSNSIAEIANGKRYEEDLDQWWLELRLGVATYLGFFAIVYILGWAVGWIWSGFFPQKQHKSNKGDGNKGNKGNKGGGSS